MRIAAFFILFCFTFCVYASPAEMSGMHVNFFPNTTQLIIFLNKKPLGSVQQTTANTISLKWFNTKQTFTFTELKTRSAIRLIQKQNSAENTVFFKLFLARPVHWQIHFNTVSKNQIMMQIDFISNHHLFSKKLGQVNDIHQPIKKSMTKNNSPRIQKLNDTTIFKPMSISAAEIDALLQSQNVNLQLNTAEKSSKKITIIIDAGHGGKDSGARGAHGVDEKNVVLRIAKYLAHAINSEPDMRAILTRDGDYFVPLRTRLKLAHKGDADIFVAIHADAYADTEAKGASVYRLSSHGATTVAARMLVQQNNYPEIGDIQFQALQDKSTMLRSVLIDLAQTETAHQSLVLGKTILNSLDNISTLHYQTVEEAPFLVLKSLDIPSVLIETGFITNTFEEARLANTAYQKKMARAILKGLKQYIEHQNLT